MASVSMISSNKENIMNEIYLDKKDIINEIEEKGQYKKDQITIKKWEDEINFDTEMYIVKNEDKNLPFFGVVNYKFEREGYCINNYSNGDQYFGYYSNNLRNKHGFYTYKPKINKKKIIYEYYFGLWKDDIKEGRGVYVWFKGDNQDKPFDNFDKSNFEAYIGGFEKDKFTKGTLLSKENDNYFVYHGPLLDGNKKHGNNCFYYCSNLDQLFYGTFNNNVFIEGYVCLFDDDGEIKDIIKYKNNTIVNNGEFSNYDSLKNIGLTLLTFRNVIMSKDYFGILFNEFAKVIKFKEENMNDVDIFNSEKYLDLMAIIASYNKISICKDIEKYINN